MRRQLIATTALIALAAILVLGIPLGLVESARARSDALGRLEREADGIAAAAVARPATPTRSRPGCGPGTRPSSWRAPGACESAGCQRGTLLATRSGATQGVRVTVYASAAEVTRRRRQVWLLVGGLAVIGTAAAAGLAVLQARRFIRPLERLADTSARLGEGDFSARAGHMELPELDRVARALDTAAVQIAQLVGRQREFAANVSHQLRTPLTAMILRLDELATLEDPAAAREEIEATLRVADRLEQTVNDLLELARVGDIGRPRDIDLAELARRHGEYWRPVYVRAGRRLRDRRRRPAARARQPGRRRAGARRPARERAHARRRASRGWTPQRIDGRGVLGVQDGGEGVPEPLEHAIFDRDVSTAGSTGLGLPLARALVEADGGRLILARATAGPLRRSCCRAHPRNCPRSVARGAPTAIRGQTRRRRRYSVAVVDDDSAGGGMNPSEHAGRGEGRASVSRESRRARARHDIIARIGGEEFAWLLPGLPIHRAFEAAERMREAIADQPFVNGLTVTISVGVSQLQPGQSGHEFRAAADAELYAAKRAGRNQTMPAQP